MAIREYTTAPPFERPVVNTGPLPVRAWTPSNYVPSDSLDARMSRAMMRAALRHLERGDTKKYRQQSLSSAILNRSENE